MVNTVKFSQFAIAPLTSANTEVVGLENGVNVQSVRFLTWTNATRPAAPFNGLLGINTNSQQYEYWDAVANMWVQLISDINNGGNISSWEIITAVSVNAASGNGFITDRSATPVQILLPATFNIGDEIGILGKGAGGWSLIANAGQTIQFGSVSTSMAGAINSDIQYANIFVRGLIADTTWTVEIVNSNPIYV